MRRRRDCRWCCWRAAGSAGARRGATAGRSSPGCARARWSWSRCTGESGPGRCSTWRRRRATWSSTLIAEHAIDCDLKLTGHLLGAVKAADMRHFEAEVRCLAEAMDYDDADLLDAGAARAQVDTPYHGALLDRRGGHMHTLNYTLGLARAAAGGRGVAARAVAGGVAGAGRRAGARRHRLRRRGARQVRGAGGRRAAARSLPSREQPDHAGRQLCGRDPAAGRPARADRQRRRRLRQPLRGQLLSPDRRRAAAVRRRRALYARSAGRHGGVRAAARGGDLPATARRRDRLRLGRPGLDHHDPPAARRPRRRGAVRARLFRHGRGALDAGRQAAGRRHRR